MFRRAVYLVLFFMISLSAHGQINLYLGGNLHGNYSVIRGEDPTFEPGFGGGLSFAYWEYEYWFLKAGLDYHKKSSSRMDYPDVFGVTPAGPDDMIRIHSIDHTVGIPLTVYFRPLERGPSTLLIAGTFESQLLVMAKESSDEWGEVVLKGRDLNKRTKTSLGFGIGYQGQLQEHTYLNIVPTYNIDIRSAREYNSIMLTIELIFGIY